MGATRDKIKKSLKKKVDKLNKKNLDYLRVGDRVVRPRTHPGVLSYSSSKNPAKAPTTSGASIKKVTVGFGKDKKGKPIGQTTWVKLGKNPSAAKLAKGARMARNQKATAPQAKAPTTTAPKGKWGPHSPYRLPKESKAPTTPTTPAPKTKSFSAASIGKAVLAAGAAVVAGVALKKQPKRKKSAAVETARARKPVSPGTKAQADPALKARSDTRRAAEGTKLKHAGYGKPPKAAAPAPKPRSILELEEPKPVTTPKAPKVKAAPAPRPAAKVQGTGPRAEIEASKRAVTTIRTPVDTSAEVEKAKAQAAELEGKLKKATLATPRAVKKVTAAASDKIKQTVANVTDANPAETKAAAEAIKTPVDTPAPAEFEDMTSDERNARQKELQARIEKGRATQEAAAAKQKAKPDERRQGEQRQAGRRDQPARAKAAEVPVGSREGSWPPGPKQSTRRARGSDRRAPEVKAQAKIDAAAQHYTDLEAAAAKSKAVQPPKPPKPPQIPDLPKSRPIGDSAPKTPAIDTDLQKKLETARELNAKLKADKEGTTFAGRPSRYDPKKVITPKPPVPKAAAAPKPPAKPVVHPLGPDPAAVKNAEKYIAADADRRAKTPERPMSALRILRDHPMTFAPEIEEAKAIVETAPETSRAATSAEATKAAAVAPTEQAQLATEIAAAKVKRAELTKQLQAAEGSTDKDAAKRKKATQKFYNDLSKRMDVQGSFRKGTSSAVNPAIAGAQPTPMIETPVSKKRRPTEELIKEQGVEVQKVAAKKAPETDATTEEWDKKKQNAETAKSTARTPLEQAKLDAVEIGTMISETEARKNTLGAKMKAAAGAPTDTLTADVAAFEGQRILQTSLTSEGEREVRILEGDALEKTVLDAQEDLRQGQDRRIGDKTRRTFATRSTAAEASEMITAADVKTRVGEKKVGAKKGTRREKQPGGDRRQKGSEWKPTNIGEQLAKLENKRPGGLPDRRGPSMADLDVFELKDAASRGDPIAKETLKQYRAELKGRSKERRATDTAPREAARLELDIERAEAGTGQTPSTSTWDPKAERRVLTPQMDVNADLMPDPKIYSGDPIKAQTLENMNKRIADFEKRLKHDPNVVYQAEETLKKLKRQRDGLAQDVAGEAQTRQFPSREAEIAEQAVKRGEKVIPRSEARTHVRSETGRRDVQRTPERRASPTGTPDAVEGMQPRRAAQRRGPHVGPERGKTVRPAPDLTVGEKVERGRPVGWVAEDPKMWERSLKRAGYTPPSLESPAIGSNIGEGISEAFKKAGSAVKRGITNPKNVARGLLGLGVGTAAFLVPEVASAYVDASGDQRDRIKAAGGKALESGIEIGAGMTVFTGALVAAEKAAPLALKPAVGVAGAAAGGAAVGWVVGTAAAGVRNRVRSVSEKNKRDREYAQKKYGTVAAATRTRKGLKADGTPMTLDDTEEIARRWERERKRSK